MNIFALDSNAELCARYHCDQHAIKMILESVQLLCTALNKKGFTTPYKSTHAKHPCVLWVESSYDNFQWLVSLTEALNAEYRYRFSRSEDHKSMEVLAKITSLRYERTGLEPFPQAMPDEFKVKSNSLEAYRNFYVGEKLSFARWTKRSPPDWLSDYGISAEQYIRH